MKVLMLALFTLTTATAFAGPFADLTEMKKAATAEFLKEANNPKTALGKRIDRINNETSDGRNQDGTITLPVEEKDLEISVLNAEILYNPWHYADKSEDGKTCTAGGNSATFLVLLASETGVHGASEYQAYPFTIPVSENFKAERIDGGVIEYCEDIFSDNEGQYKEFPVEFSLGEIKESKINL